MGVCIALIAFEDGIFWRWVLGVGFEVWMCSCSGVGVHGDGIDVEDFRKG